MSLNNKSPFLQTLLVIEEPDAVFISETWYKDNSCPSFPGYTLFRKDRVGPRQGGGVCVYIKSIYKSYEIPESELGFSDLSIESVWCCCTVNSEKLLLGCIYRPGDASNEANKQIRGKQTVVNI